MAKLLIVLPIARDYCGRGILLSGAGERLFGPFRVLGTASRGVSGRNGNPGHERRLPFGDPPSGTYRISGSLPPGTSHRRPKRFGLLGALLLEPTGGEALSVAAGRPRIVLHGGRCDQRGRLRRTRGGLRVGDADLAPLFAAVNQTQLDGDPVSTVEIVDSTITGQAEPPGQSLARARRPGRAAGPWKAAAMLAVGVGAAVKTPASRRQFLRAALLVCGGLAIGACNQPGPYVAYPPCDPSADPNCEPTGASGDYTSSGDDTSSGGGTTGSDYTSGGGVG